MYFGSSVWHLFHVTLTGPQTFDVAATFVENLCTPDESVPAVPLYFCMKANITENQEQQINIRIRTFTTISFKFQIARLNCFVLECLVQSLHAYICPIRLLSDIRPRPTVCFPSVSIVGLKSLQVS